MTGAACWGCPRFCQQLAWLVVTDPKDRSSNDLDDPLRCSGLVQWLERIGERMWPVTMTLSWIALSNLE